MTRDYATNEEYRSLLAGVYENLDDLAPAKVLADWLDERGFEEDALLWRNGVVQKLIKWKTYQTYAVGDWLRNLTLLAPKVVAVGKAFESITATIKKCGEDLLTLNWDALVDMSKVSGTEKTNAEIHDSDWYPPDEIGGEDG